MLPDKITFRIIRLLYLCEAFAIIFHVIGKTQMVTPLFYFTFVLVFLMFVNKIGYKIHIFDLVCFFLIMCSFVNIMINAVLCDSAITFTYLKKYIMFTVTIMFFYVARNIEIDKYTRRYIMVLIKGLVIFLIAYYYFNSVNVFLLDGKVSRYLTFGLTNPNLTVLFLLCFAFILFIEFLQEKNKLIKVLDILMGGYLCLFILLTRSRNGILILCIFLSLLIYMHIKKSNLRIGKKLSLFISIFPLLFIVMYFTMINNQSIANVFDFLVEKGKELDSRVIIWSFALEKFKTSPVFGAYSQISNGSGISQLHNSHLDIMASYGVLPLILTCYLLYKLLNNNNKLYQDKSNYLYTIGFAFSLLMGMGEAAVFAGGLGIYLFSGVFLLLRNE